MKRTSTFVVITTLMFSFPTSYGVIVGETFTDIYSDRPERRDSGAFWSPIFSSQLAGKVIISNELKS